MAAHQGGTLKLLAKAAGGTIDPQVNYTLQYWQLYQATYDGLLGFKKAGGNAAFKVVPDLATERADADERRQDVGLHAPQGDQVLERQAGDDGQTWSPHFQRIFKVESPTSGTFYAGIVGAKACLAKPATCTLKGGVSANARPAP